MVISPYQQTLTHSCLAACFLMLQEKQFTKFDEQELALKGSSRKYPFYVVGIPEEFVKKYDGNIKIYADNNFFATTLQKAFIGNKKIHVTHKKIDMAFITELLNEKPLICHIDNHALGDYSHVSHFIILEKATKEFVTIIDPWSGKKKKISKSTLTEAISDLKNHVKMCPLLFSVE
ncbi:MAG: hypothetical protein HZC02_01550 [Candidatus Levybacteria bacterium]|nr:hypothetical protein [Candidatus Levybacteria bacterium]